MVNFGQVQDMVTTFESIYLLITYASIHTVGHSAAAVGLGQMIIYGGRGVGGRLLNDVWLVRLCSGESPNGVIWELLHDGSVDLDSDSSSVSYPCPPARMFSACCAIPKDVTRQMMGEGATALTTDEVEDIIIFGGTNGEINFGDVWILRCNGYPGLLRPNMPYWELALTDGFPPSPRYGHHMLLLDDGRMMVLGGCCVSPAAEMEWGIEAARGDSRALQALALSLQRSYREECREALNGGRALETLTSLNGAKTSLSLLDRDISGPKALSRKAGDIAARYDIIYDIFNNSLCNVVGCLSVAAREAASAEAEKRLGLAWKGAYVSKTQNDACDSFVLFVSTS